MKKKYNKIYLIIMINLCIIGVLYSTYKIIYWKDSNNENNEIIEDINKNIEVNTNEEDNSNILFNKNERFLSINESIDGEQSKRKLQGIFNENIDCGIIIFSKEASDVDFFNKIKSSKVPQHSLR